jgi:hypothetical protein
MLNNLTNAAFFNIPAGAQSTLEGMVTNNGTFQVPGTLFVSGAVTLAGTGSGLLVGGNI